jgi:hypothetical protein
LSRPFRLHATYDESIGCASACGVHAHAHAWDRTAPAEDARSFWGALGCSCWAF